MTIEQLEINLKSVQKCQTSFAWLKRFVGTRGCDAISYKNGIYKRPSVGNLMRGSIVISFRYIMGRYKRQQYGNQISSWPQESSLKLCYQVRRLKQRRTGVCTWSSNRWVIRNEKTPLWSLFQQRITVINFKKRIKIFLGWLVCFICVACIYSFSLARGHLKRSIACDVDHH